MNEPKTTGAIAQPPAPPTPPHEQGGGGGYTPGPWTWDAGPADFDGGGSLRYCDVSANDGDLIIASINDFFNKAEGHANARLIAAAPSMVEALKEAREALEPFMLLAHSYDDDAVPVPLGDSVPFFHRETRKTGEVIIAYGDLRRARTALAKIDSALSITGEGR